VLLFGGEPGVGKTRLLDEAAALAAQAGWRVLHGDCRRRAGDPYAPLTEAVADSLRRLPQGERQSVVRVAPFLHLLLPELLGTGDVRFDEEVGIAPSPSALPPEHRRRLLFAAVTDYLHAVAGAAGTLLVLDDLQWAGEDALDLLASSALIERGQALMRPDAKRLRVIGAYRDTEPLVGSPLGEFVAELARGSSVRMLSLGPFSDAWAEKLLLGQISAG
jgi:predicted ATPase